ncbi:MAG: hypothetical protein OEZ36_02045 [Spirochaetota bacterium]|nr:hypothetical protein [Spirochaetota bacterium]
MTIKQIIISGILGLSLIQCGIPSNELFDDPNTPKNLTWLDSGSTGDGKIVISFTAYNPEASFKGFNVYMALTEADVRQQHVLHVTSNVINNKVEQNYIVQNKFTRGYPTILDADAVGVDAIRNNPGTITYTITKSPGDRTLTALTWFVGITAMNEANNLESALSQVIAVTP